MANITTNQIDLGAIALKNPEFRDDTFTAAGAKTFKAGTILARDSVSLKLVVYAIGGSTNQNGIPKAVLAHDLVAAGAGDLPVRAIISGVVNATRLVVDADGNATNVTKAILDLLRAFGIVPQDVLQTSLYDN